MPPLVDQWNESNQDGQRSDDRAHRPSSAGLPSDPTASLASSELPLPTTSYKMVRPLSDPRLSGQSLSGPSRASFDWVAPGVAVSASDDDDDDQLLAPRSDRAPSSSRHPRATVGAAESLLVQGGSSTQLVAERPLAERGVLPPQVTVDDATDGSTSSSSSRALPSGPFADALSGRRPASFLSFSTSPSAVAGPSLAPAPPAGSPSSSTSSSRTVTPEEDQMAPSLPRARTHWFDSFLSRSRGETASFGSVLARPPIANVANAAAGPSALPAFSALARSPVNSFASTSSSVVPTGSFPNAPATSSAVKMEDDAPEVVAASQTSTILSTTNAKGKGKEKAAWIGEDDLSCAICQDIYVGSSSVIPCGHSFCGQCIWDYVKAKNTSCPICRAEMPLVGTKIIPNYAFEEVICRWAEATLDETDKKEWVSRKDGWLAYKLALEDEAALATVRTSSARPTSLFAGSGNNLGSLLADYAPNLYGRPGGYGGGAVGGRDQLPVEASRRLAERSRAADDNQRMRAALRSAYANRPVGGAERPRGVPRQYAQASSEEDDDDDYRPAVRQSIGSFFARREADFPALPSAARPPRPEPARPARPIRRSHAMFDPPPPPSGLVARPAALADVSAPERSLLSPRSRRRRAVLGSSPPPGPAPVAGPSTSSRSSVIADWMAEMQPVARPASSGASASAGPSGAGGRRPAAAAARPVAPLPRRRTGASVRPVDVVDLISD